MWNNVKRWKMRLNNVKHVKMNTHHLGSTPTYTHSAFLEVVLSRSTLSFDPNEVFFWPTYWVDPSGFGLFALVKCVQCPTPLMCKYRLYKYKNLSWSIAYWFQKAVWILPCLQVDKTLLSMRLQIKPATRSCTWKTLCRNITIRYEQMV